MRKKHLIFFGDKATPALFISTAFLFLSFFIVSCLFYNVEQTSCLFNKINVYAEEKENEGEKVKQLSEEKYIQFFENAVAHYEKANLLNKKDKKKDALSELKEILEMPFSEDDKNIEGFNLKLDAYAFAGEIYLEINQGRKAIETVKKGISETKNASPQLAHLYLMLGHIYKELKMDDEAIEVFDKGIEINEKLQKEKEAKEAKKNKKSEKRGN